MVPLSVLRELLNCTPRISAATATVAAELQLKILAGCSTTQLYIKMINYTFIKQKLDVERAMLLRNASATSLKIVEVVGDMMTNGVQDNSGSSNETFHWSE